MLVGELGASPALASMAARQQAQQGGASGQVQVVDHTWLEQCLVHARRLPEGDFPPVHPPAPAVPCPLGAGGLGGRGAGPQADECPGSRVRFNFD